MYFYHAYSDIYNGPPTYGPLRRATTLTNAIKGCRRDMVRRGYNLGYILKADKESDLIPDDYSDRLYTDKYLYRASKKIGVITDETYYNNSTPTYLYYPSHSRKGYPIKSDGTIIRR